MLESLASFIRDDAQPEGDAAMPASPAASAAAAASTAASAAATWGSPSSVPVSATSAASTPIMGNALAKFGLGLAPKKRLAMPVGQAAGGPGRVLLKSERRKDDKKRVGFMGRAPRAVCSSHVLWVLVGVAMFVTYVMCTNGAAGRGRRGWCCLCSPVRCGAARGLPPPSLVARSGTRRVVGIY